MGVNMGTVWDRTTEFLGDNLRIWLPIALLVVFLPQMVNDLLQLATDSIGQAVAQVLGLVLTLVALWGQLVIVALALDPDGGRPFAQATATRNYGRAVLVMIVLFVAIMLLLAPIAIMLAASGMDLSLLASGQPQPSAPDLSPGMGLGMGFYGILLAIVALVVGARLTLLYPAVLAEGLSLGAIGRSFALTRGLTWKLIGVMVLFLIVFAVAATAARTVFGTIVGLIFPAQGALTPATVVGAICGALVTAVFTLIIAAFSAKLYRAVAPASVGAAVPA